MTAKLLRLSDDLALPLTAVTEKLAWLGRTGSGKTYGAMKLAELMLEAGAQIGAIDPVGVWRALRVRASKAGPSFEVVVFGGLSGDLPLEPTKAAGELVADLVCDRGLSFVLDISQCIPSEQQTFLQGFTHRFFHIKKAKPSAVHLFLEECQEYIPENPSGTEAITLGHMQRLWKLGRNFGIGGSLISQRPQEIAKKALNMSGTLFAFQMTGPQERKAIKAWVADQGVAVDIESILQKLHIGQPHVESPTFLKVSRTVHILPRVTADLSSTPLVGEATAAKRPLTPIDVAQLTAAMAATIEKAKADDPRELRKQIKALEQQLAGKVMTKVAVHLRDQKPVLTDADRALLKELATVIRETHEQFAGESALAFATEQVKAENQIGAAIEKAYKRFRDEIGAVVVARHREFAERLEKTRVQKILDKLTHITPHAEAAPRSPHARRVDPGPSTPRPARVVSADAGGELGKGERQVLIAIAQHAEGVTREQLTQLTGYKRSTRDTYIQRLSQRGAVEVENVIIRVTSSGLTLLGDDYEELPTGSALLAHWLSKLPDGERKLLELLARHYPNAVDRERISDATGYARSSRDTYLQRLSARRLVTSEGRGAVRAAAELFD